LKYSRRSLIPLRSLLRCEIPMAYHRLRVRLRKTTMGRKSAWTVERSLGADCSTCGQRIGHLACSRCTVTPLHVASLLLDVGTSGRASSDTRLNALLGCHTAAEASADINTSLPRPRGVGTTARSHSRGFSNMTEGTREGGFCGCLHQCGGCMAIVGLDGRFQRVSSSLCRILERTVEELVGVLFSTSLILEITTSGLTTCVVSWLARSRSRSAKSVTGYRRGPRSGSG